MAAIDKLYVHHYYEYIELRNWAIVYYPKLLLCFYNWQLTWKEYDENKAYWIETSKEYAQRDFKRFGKFKSNKEAVQNLIKHYKETADYDCSVEQAKEELEKCIEEYNRTDEEWEEYYSFAVMNTPFHIDRKLKWICPIHCVREYLHKQCGVNPKWEWLYKIFWRGKKYF